MASESLAYDALRVFVNWQRERRLHKVRERKQAARTSNELLAAGGVFNGGQSLAIRVDGSIACWGANGDGQAPPDGVPGNFVAIAAGALHSLALRVDGSIACWGYNGDGRAPPAGVQGDFVAIAAGGAHSLALRADGSVACWGGNNSGQAPPASVSGPFRVTQADL